MPAYVTRKQLKPGAIFNIYLDVSMAGSELRRTIEKKRLNRKIVESALGFIRRAESRLEIRLPDKKPKVTKPLRGQPKFIAMIDDANFSPVHLCLNCGKPLKVMPENYRGRSPKCRHCGYQDMRK